MMPADLRTAKTVQLRVDKSIVDRVESLTKEFPGAKSITSLAEAVLDQMLTLMESHPAERQMPDLIVQLDAVRSNRAKKTLLADVLSSKAVDRVAGKLIRDGVAEVKGAKR